MTRWYAEIRVSADDFIPRAKAWLARQADAAPGPPRWALNGPHGHQFVEIPIAQKKGHKG